MEARLQELLAETVLAFSKKVGMEYDSDEFQEILIEDAGFEQEEVDDIIEIINSL